jgi:hypothetical protein
MKWGYFIIMTYSPALIWSILTLRVLFKYPRIHQVWPKTLLAGVLLSAAPYPLGYYLCRKVALSCPASIGPVTDFLVMTGAVLIGLVLAGVWNKGFEALLRKKDGGK